MTDVAVDDATAESRHPVSNRVKWRIRRLVIMLALVAICFNNSPGRIAPDTKVDLTVDPWGFLGRALHLWDPQGFAGQLQNQAFGYLFPMGPFFGIGHSLGLPPWVVGRLWWGLVLCVAFIGMTLLIERMTPASPIAATLGGLAYAGSPHVLTVIGPVSSEIWPMAVAPFVLLPLLRPPETISPHKAAARSAVAVLCMGAINATATFAAVLPAALWLATRRLTGRSLKLLAWWVLFVLLACVWWMVPLFVLGNFSPPFLGYIENAAIVTSTNSLFETLRGTSDWVAYLPFSGWTAGALLLTQGAAVLSTGLVVVGGLIGLCRTDLPHRRFLIGLLIIGVTLSCAGFVGSLDGPWAETVRDWLDGSLSPLRNVHKFDVLLRMPLCIGLAMLLSKVRWGTTKRERRASGRMAAVAGGLMIVAAASPAIVLQLSPNGGYGDIPDHWRQAARWLDKNAHGDRALVVPGARFAYFDWGRPKDEPLQALTDAPWTVRDAVPIVPPGNIRMLNAVQELFDSSRPSKALAPYLNEHGIDYLVVRNDLDYAAVGSPRPAQVHATLLGSPNIKRVASFGRSVGSAGTWAYAIDQGLQQSYPAVEIFRVGKPHHHPHVRLLPQDRVVQVYGGPESGLDLQKKDGSIPTSVLAGDLFESGDPIKPKGVVVTDSLRRRDVTFGRNDNAVSQTLMAREPRRVPKRVGDYLPTWAAGFQTVAAYRGIRGVWASSSASDASAAVRSVRGEQPFAALDRDGTTAWRTPPFTNPVGQWIRVDLLNPVAVPYVDVSFVGSATGTVTDIEIDTDFSSQSAKIVNPGGLTRIPLDHPADKITQLTVQIAGVKSKYIDAEQVGISTLDLAGILPQRYLRVPRTFGASPVDAFSFSAGPDRSNGCLVLATTPLCSASLARAGEDAAGVYRQFHVPAPRTYEPEATVAARPSFALNALLKKAIDAPMDVAVSSSVVPDPLAGAFSLNDRDPRTSWIAAATDPLPTATYSFDDTRTISKLSIDLPPSSSATWPTAIKIATGKRSQIVRIDDPKKIKMTPMKGKKFDLTLSAPALRLSWNPDNGFPEKLGLGLAGISFNDVPTAPRSKVDAREVTMKCGSGPDIVVGGRTFKTKASPTVKDLRELRPMRLTICSKRDSVRLTKGEHLLRAASSELWGVETVSLKASDSDALDSGAEPVGKPKVRSWEPTSASVHVPRRDATSVLVVDENTNPGWRGTFEGRELKPVVIGGWQQGYVLPAGAAGTVNLEFWPDSLYRAGLGLGLLGALIVVEAAVWPSRRRSFQSDEFFGESDRDLAGLALASVAAFGSLAVGGWFAFVTAVSLMGMTLWAQDKAAANRRLAVMAGGAFLAATVGVATGPVLSDHYRAPDTWVQLFCVVSLVCVAASGLTDAHWPWVKRETEESGPDATAG